MAYPDDTTRDDLSRLGNWHDVVDEIGNGSLIAVLKNFNKDFNVSELPTYARHEERGFLNRIGNFTDEVDQDGNGSLLAQVKVMLAGITAIVISVAPRNLHLVAHNDPAIYNVAVGDAVIRVDTTDEEKTIIYTPNSAPLQETSIYKTAGANDVIITDGTDTIGVIGAVGVIMKFQDLVTEIKQTQ